MKKLVSIIVITCMLLMSFGSVGYAAAFQPIIEVDGGKVGDIITVTVSLPENTNAAGGSFNLVYDNTKVELVDAAAGEVISAFTKTVNKTYDVNKVRLNFAGTETVPEDGGVVLKAEFRLVEAGEANFYTEKFKLADIDTNYLTCEDNNHCISIEEEDIEIVYSPGISAQDGTVGDIITVDVYLPVGTNVAGGSFNLVYDNTKVELIDAWSGDILSGFTVTINETYDENRVRMNFAGTTVMPEAGGTLLSADFRLVESGTATFETEKFKLANIDEKYLTCDNASTSIAIIAPEPVVIPVNGVSINKTFVNLTVGEKVALIATVFPENATNRKIYWESSDLDVAKVSTNGVVTARNAGSAIITVTTEDGGYTSICKVEVSENIVDENEPKITVTGLRTLPGREFEVTVDLENNTGFASLGIEIGYDAGVMTLVNVTPNPNVGGTFTPAQNYGVNPFNMSWDSTTNNTYNGNLATLTFEVEEDAPDGYYPITVDYYKGVHGNYIDGSSVNYDENFEAVGFVYVSGNVLVKCYVAGDVDGDEIVDDFDATHLLRYLAGWDVEIVNMEALDVNGNGTVDSKDATVLLRYLAGWDVEIH